MEFINILRHLCNVFILKTLGKQKHVKNLKSAKNRKHENVVRAIALTTVDKHWTFSNLKVIVLLVNCEN